MSAALTPEVEIGTEVPTALYRLFAGSGSLLYVGITGNLKARFGQHASEKPWWPDVSRKTVTWYPSRDKALGAEATAIRDERPRHNARRELAPMRPERWSTWEDFRWEDILWVLMMFMLSTEHDIRQWHARMILTAAPRLINLLGGDWWDMSPELLDVLDALPFGPGHTAGAT